MNKYEAHLEHFSSYLSSVHGQTFYTSGERSATQL